MLPADGSLGAVHTKLAEMLARWDMLPSDAAAWQREDFERQIEESCTVLHAAIIEGVTISSRVRESRLERPTVGHTLRHSAEFGELSDRLAQVRRTQQAILSELRDALSEDSWRAGLSSRLHSARGGPGKDRAYQTWPSGRCHSGASSPRTGRASPRQLPSKPSTSSLVLLSPMNQPPPSRGGVLKVAPKIEALSEPLAARGKTRQRELVRPNDFVDFGFRPDGGGEESVENWSLFKVSKGCGPIGGATGSTSLNYRTGNSSLFRDTSSAKFRLSDSKAAKFGKISADCNFRDYMDQNHGDSGGMWRSSSTPALPEIKKGPSLPQLVKVKVKDSSLSAATSAGATRYKGDSHNGSSGAKSSALLRTTAPLGASFAKW